MAQLKNFTGAELLVLTGGIPIGRVGITEIDVDIENAGDHSKMNTARANFVSWASELSITLSALTDAQFSALELALKYYALYLYQEWDLMLRNKSECGEDDYRRRANLRQQCILALKQIGSSASDFIAKFEAAINTETSAGQSPADITDLIEGSIITDDKCAAKYDYLRDDYKVKIDES